MGKKLAVFMTLVCIGLAALVVKLKLQADDQGPEITFRDADLVYQNGMTEAELLADAVSLDAAEGDVSSMLTVENVYEISDEQVVVVYVARDSKNNITKVKRTLRYKREESDDIGEEGADTEADEPQATPTPVPTETPAFSDAERVRAEQIALADEMPENMPRVYLTDYWIEVPVGTTINALSYVESITDDSDSTEELWKKIQLRDEERNPADPALSFAAAGTYVYTFLVVDSQNNVSNQAALTVVVK